MRVSRLLSVIPLVVSLSAGAASSAHAQSALSIDPTQPVPTQPEADRPLVQAGLGLMIAVPIGDFGDNVGVSPGITFHLDFGLGNSPVSIGAEGTLVLYGSQTRNVPLVGIPDLAVGVETENDMFLLHGRVRVQRPDGRVRPYVDGLVGFNYITTTTSVDAEDTCYWVGNTYSCTDGGDSITNLDDLVLSVGGGAGVQFAFGASPHSMRLDLSLRYLYGGEARYMAEGDIRWESEGLVILEPRRSRTDMLMVYVGLAWGR